ncbi:hypothetical protein Tco_0447436, partial [Tanacetum coccineum]
PNEVEALNAVQASSEVQAPTTVQASSDVQAPTSIQAPSQTSVVQAIKSDFIKGSKTNCNSSTNPKTKITKDCIKKRS